MEWVDRLAAELRLDPLSAHENEHLLTASREVAHRVERKATPLAMYVLGLSVGKPDGRPDSATTRSRTRSDAPAPPAPRRRGLTRFRTQRVGWSAMTDRMTARDADDAARRAPGRHVRPRRRRPADLGHRPVQLPMHLLHAGRGSRVAPEARDPDLRGAHAAARDLRGARGALAQGHGRRAARCAPTSRCLSGCSARSARTSTSRSRRTACSSTGWPSRSPRPASTGRRSRATRCCGTGSPR